MTLWHLVKQAAKHLTGRGMDDMIHNDYSIGPLAAAVIVQAAREARQGDQAARQWLLTEAPLWMDAIGLDLQPAQVHRWISRGCKIPQRGALQLGA